MLTQLWFVAELKDTLEHVGTALKQRLVESVRSTWNTVYQTMFFNRTDDHAIEQEVNKVSLNFTWEVVVVFIVQGTLSNLHSQFEN